MLSFDVGLSLSPPIRSYNIYFLLLCPWGLFCS
jgi:hypothetical protein